MNALTKKLNRFLCACKGNWRNAVFVFSQNSGYVMALDRDAKPILFEANTYMKLTGDEIDSSECCRILSEQDFRTIFAQYLLWEFPNDVADLLAELCRRNE